MHEDETHRAVRDDLDRPIEQVIESLDFSSTVIDAGEHTWQMAKPWQGRDLQARALRHGFQEPLGPRWLLNPRIEPSRGPVALCKAPAQQAPIRVVPSHQRCVESELPGIIENIRGGIPFKRVCVGPLDQTEAVRPLRNGQDHLFSKCEAGHRDLRGIRGSLGGGRVKALILEAIEVRKHEAGPTLTESNRLAQFIEDYPNHSDTSHPRQGWRGKRAVAILARIVFEQGFPAGLDVHNGENRPRI